MHPRIQSLLSASLPFLLSAWVPLCAQDGVPASTATGPTPYPPAENQEAWPGKGIIRVHDWFKDNRAYFWTLREKKKGAVVVAGDSLVGNWKNLEAAFPNLLMANRGIGGEVSRSLLFRFQEDILDLQPKAVVILVGTNDLSAHGDPEDTVSNLSDMLAMAQRQNPAMPVVLCTIPPRNNPKAPTKPGKQDELNQKIRGLADGKANVKILDLFKALSNADGTPDPQYFNQDLLHLSGAGFSKFGEELQKLFPEMKIQ